MGEKHVGTYRGCEIYYLTPPDVPKAVYMSPCISGHYFKRSAVETRIDAYLEQLAAEELMDSHVQDYYDHIEGLLDGADVDPGQDVGDVLDGVEGNFGPGGGFGGGGADDTHDDVEDGLNNSVDDANTDTGYNQAGILGDIQNAVDGVKGWVFDRFADIGIDLEGALIAIGESVDFALDDLGVNINNVRNELNQAIYAGLEDAGGALSTIAGQLSASAAGILDAAYDAISPLIEGLTVGFIGLIEGFKEMLDIDIDTILEAQDELQRRTVERQIKDLVPIEEAED